jgi:hypothetical protein
MSAAKRIVPAPADLTQGGIAPHVPTHCRRLTGDFRVTALVRAGTDVGALAESLFDSLAYDPGDLFPEIVEVDTLDVRVMPTLLPARSEPWPSGRPDRRRDGRVPPRPSVPHVTGRARSSMALMHT